MHLAPGWPAIVQTIAVSRPAEPLRPVNVTFWPGIVDRQVGIGPGLDNAFSRVEVE
jgi:hypothetical protein